MKIFIYIAVLLILTYFPKITEANSSQSNVKIINSVNSSTNQNTVSKTETHITINTDGKVQTYDSNQPGEINVQSENGDTKVEVNNSVGNSKISTSNNTSLITPISTIAIQNDKPIINNKLKQNINKSKQSIFEEIFLYLKHIFSRL
jgi:hypothetical protein